MWQSIQSKPLNRSGTIIFVTKPANTPLFSPCGFTLRHSVSHLKLNVPTGRLAYSFASNVFPVHIYCSMVDRKLTIECACISKVCLSAPRTFYRSSNFHQATACFEVLVNTIGLSAL